MSKSILSKRMFIIGLLAFLIGLVGCSSDNNDNNDKNNNNNNNDTNNETADGDWEGQSITVQMIGEYKMESTTDPITGEKVAGVEVLKEEFEDRYPGATVDFILMPWEGFTEKTQAMITSNEADVYQMPGLPDMAAQGVLEPLQPLIDEDEDFDLDIFIENQVDGWKVLGPESEDLEIYGLPFLGDARFNMYDKQIFDDWGVEYLSEYPTMEEILDKAEQMTGTNPVTGEQNFGVWFRGDWDSYQHVVNAAEGQNGQWGTGFDWNEMEFSFNSPEMLNGLEWLLELQEFAPKGLTSNQGSEKWLTEDNNIAIMLNQGPGEIKSIYAQGLDDRIAIAQQFKNDEGQGGLFAGSPIAIAKDSENKELAWEWLKFATGEFTQKYLFEEVGDIPAIKASADWDSMEERELMLDVFEAMKSPWTPRYPWSPSQPGTILSTEVEAALTGKRTPEEALDKAQKETEEWLENR